MYLVYKIKDNACMPTWQYKTPLTMNVGDCFIEKIMEDGEFVEIWIKKTKHAIVDGLPVIECISLGSARRK